MLSRVVSTVIFTFAWLFVAQAAFAEADSECPQKSAQYQRHVEIFYENARKTKEMQIERERQLRESARLQEVKKKQLEKAELQAQRMDRILKRWDEQADRYDKLLEKWAAQGGE